MKICWLVLVAAMLVRPASADFYFSNQARCGFVVHAPDGSTVELKKSACLAMPAAWLPEAEKLVFEPVLTNALQHFSAAKRTLRDLLGGAQGCAAGPATRVSALFEIYSETTDGSFHRGVKYRRLVFFLEYKNFWWD